MKCRTQKLEELCSIKVGSPSSRAKKIPEGVEPTEVKVLLPRAMQGGAILDEELADELVGNAKEGSLTQLDDVIVKLSTPYDCVRIDKAHTGILVTSFGIVLRKKEGAPIDMRYLSMFLNAPQTNTLLSAVSMGSTTTMAMLKRKTLADIDVPVLPMRQQELLAELFETVQKRRTEYQKLIDLDQELMNSQLTTAIWGE